MMMVLIFTLWSPENARVLPSSSNYMRVTYKDVRDLGCESCIESLKQENSKHPINLHAGIF